jgi:F-type H+-transporting ATPase subunit delta
MDPTIEQPPPNESHADVGAERLARVYAESLLAAARPAGEEETIIGELDSLIDDVVSKDPRLGVLVTGAAVGRNARRAVIEKVFRNRASDLFVRFLLVLNEHERLDLVRAIRTAVHDIENERHRRIKVQLFTATPLPEEYAVRIADAVRQRFHLEPILVPHVDPALLGGLKVRIGDRQIDATVRTRLDNIRNQVIVSSRHEIQSRRDRFSTE